MSTGLALLSGVICVWLVCLVWEQSAGENASRKGLLAWAGQGLVVPALVWTLFNSTLFPALPVFDGEVLLAKTFGEPWGALLLAFLGRSTGILASFWGAFTLVLLAVQLGARVQQKGDYLAGGLIYLVLVLPVGWLVFHLWGTAGLGVVAAGWGALVVHHGVELLPDASARPYYARALAHKNFGKYREAEWEVIRQLERCEDDFEGWMMLADLYANQFGEIGEAALSIRELCDQENVTPFQMSLALHRLAGWYLKKARDPAGARAALEFLCSKLPGTHWARMAELRLRQIPSNREEWLALEQGRTVRLAPPEDEPVPARRALSPEEQERAARCLRESVQRLQFNPNDALEREHCARLLAEELNQPGLGIEQLELLIDLAEVPPAQKAKWLLKKGYWQLHLLGEAAAAMDTFRWVVAQHPQSAEAFKAQREVNLIQAGERMNFWRTETVRRV